MIGPRGRNSALTETLEAKGPVCVFPRVEVGAARNFFKSFATWRDEGQFSCGAKGGDDFLLI